VYPTKEKVSEYVPEGRFSIWYFPSALVEVPFPSLANATLTPGRGTPSASVTVPLMVAVLSDLFWACKGDVRNDTVKRKVKNMRIFALNRCSIINYLISNKSCK